MKKSAIILASLSIFMLVLQNSKMVYSQNTMKEDFVSMEKRYREAVSKDHPKSALEICDQVIEKAEKERNYGWYFWGYLNKLEQLDKFAPDSIYVYLDKLENSSQTESNATNKMLLHSILANIYSQHGLLPRRRTDLEITNEIRLSPLHLKEWTQNQVNERVVQHLLSSVEDMGNLSAITSDTYIPLVVKGKNKSQNFSDISEYFNFDLLHLVYFLNLRTIDNLQYMPQRDVKNLRESITERCIEQYDKIDNSAATLYIRFNSIESYTPEEEKFEQLERLYNSYGNDNKFKEDLLSRMAKTISSKDKVRALQLCNDYKEKYPGGKCIEEVNNLIETILNPQVSVSIPYLALKNDSTTVKISHKNSSGITIKRIKITNESQFKELKKSSSITNNIRKAVENIPDSEWEQIHIDLQPSTNYEIADTEFNIASPKDFGIYVYKFVIDGLNYNHEENYSVQRVSNLSFLLLTGGQKRNDALVLDRITGKPIKGAKIEIKEPLYDNRKKGEYKHIGTYLTDSDGKITINDGRSHRGDHSDYWEWDITYNDDIAYPIGNYYLDDRKVVRRDNSSIVKLFTDRGVYRPGQTIFFKGIAYEQRGDYTDAGSNEAFEIKLFDSNNKIIATTQLITNEFGSFDGSFAIPQNTLNGTFAIECNAISRQKRQYCRVSFEVAEYKRPTFEVKWDEFRQIYTKGDTIELTGIARSLSDISVSDAEVKITATPHFNHIYRYGGKLSSDYEKVIVVSTKTDNDGKFSFSLPIENDNNDLVRYTIAAEVTAINGETQICSTSLALNEKGYYINLDSGNIFCKDNPIEFAINLINSNFTKIDNHLEYKLKDKSGRTVDSGEADANQNIRFTNWDKLKSGRYIFEADIKGGGDNKLSQEIVLFSFSDSSPVENTPLWCQRKGDTLYYGTSYEDAVIFIDIVGGESVYSFKKVDVSNQIKKMDIRYRPSYKDGVCITLFILRDEQLYTESIYIRKPLPEKRLKMKWNVFRDKLETGTKERWSLTILDKDDKPADAELLAFMYDSSLDLISPNRTLPTSFALSFPRYYSSRYFEGETSSYSEEYHRTSKGGDIRPFNRLEYIRDNIVLPNFYFMSSIMTKVSRLASASVRKSSYTKAYSLASVQAEEEQVTAENDDIKTTDAQENGEKITPRSNFAETAFFYPTLKTNENGEIAIEFTLPESLTRWKFMAFGHTKQIDFGSMEEDIIAQKDFTISPNMPRFLRKGDVTNITSTISNLTQKDISAQAIFEIFNPATEEIYAREQKNISVSAGRNEKVTFELSDYPEDIQVVGIRITAKGENFSDGEQHLLTILPNTTRITESIPMPVRGNSQKTFSLSKLFNNQSSSARNKSLTIELTSNPAWHAILALPTMADNISDNAIVWSSGLYSNLLSLAIVNRTPAIKNAIEVWSKTAKEDTPLESKLYKNQELKNIILDQSPWIYEAESQSAQIGQISNLFNTNNTNNNIQKAIGKLKELQLNDGGWCWFKGMKSSRLVSDYVLTLLARVQKYAKEELKNYTVEITEMQKKGIEYLNNCALKEYQNIMEYQSAHPEAKPEGISYMALRYLYILSLTYNDENFILISQNRLNPIFKEPLQYFLKKVYEKPTMWDIQEKAMAAMVLKKDDRTDEAKEIIKSIREYLTQDENYGMFFDFTENPWGWNKLKINAQSAAIEAIDAITPQDSLTLDEMKIWLLSQKQTQDWGTSPLSADAIYSLLMIGTNPLDSSGKLEADLIETKRSEGEKIESTPFLGYTKEKYTDSATVNTSSITLTKTGSGIAWGAVYATFDETISNVQESSTDQLSVSKELYIKRSVPFGTGYKDELVAITEGNTPKVGDIVTARMIIKVGRDIDFVQLKEQRAACFEPIGQLSGYTYGGGTWYYLEQKDASANFFFEHLNKGTYVLELNYRVSREGTYDSGFASLQSAYAPEFTAHSKSVGITIGN